MQFSNFRIFSKVSLRTQLTLLMLAMLAASLWAGYWVSSRVERDALSEVRNSVEALTKAVDVSVQQLHFSSGSSQAYLISFQAGLKARGLRQITLYNAQGEVLARTPLSEGEEDSRKGGLYETVNVNLPVLSGGRLLGYVNLKLSLANYQALFSGMLWSKTMLSLAIFALGLVIVWPLAGLVTHSFRGIRYASQQVANGDLEVHLPPPSDRDTAALISSFGRMVEQLKRQRELETRFAAAEREAAVGRMASGIAHDIRNPLNYVKLAVQEVQARLRKGGDSSETTGRLLDGVCTEIDRIEVTMQDLLDFGRPAVPAMTLEDPMSILEESVGDVRRRHGDEELDIQIGSHSAGAAVYVDPSLLRRALVNVLENALEASPQGGPVTAGWELRDGGGEQTGVFWVQDSGPGIPAENLEKIFVPYFTTKASGVGLGLALTGKWVEEMGGRVQVANQPDGGARFEFQFPVREPQAT